MLLAIWGTYLESYRAQERAAKASGAAYHIAPVGPSWLEPITGQVGNVTVVVLEEPPLKSDARAHLHRLTELREIWTEYAAEMTDSDLAYMRGLPHLEKLVLKGHYITDAGMPHLQKLENLEDLSIYHTRVTDAGLVHLKALTKLTRLQLIDNEIDGPGLRHVAHLPCLEELWLTDGCAITDRDIEPLKRMQNLRLLHLTAGPELTDKGLLNLVALKHLEYVFITGHPRVTWRGADNLRKAIPTREIVVGESIDEYNVMIIYP
jgi:hypothetical protein